MQTFLPPTLKLRDETDRMGSQLFATQLELVGVFEKKESRKETLGERNVIKNIEEKIKCSSNIIFYAHTKSSTASQHKVEPIVDISGVLSWLSLYSSDVTHSYLPWLPAVCSFSRTIAAAWWKKTFSTRVDDNNKRIAECGWHWPKRECLWSHGKSKKAARKKTTKQKMLKNTAVNKLKMNEELVRGSWGWSTSNNKIGFSS